MTATQQPVSLPAQGQSYTSGAIGVASGWGATHVSAQSFCGFLPLQVGLCRSVLATGSLCVHCVCVCALAGLSCSADCDRQVAAHRFNLGFS